MSHVPAWGYRYQRSPAGAVFERSFGVDWTIGVGAFADVYDEHTSYLPSVATEVTPGTTLDAAYRRAVFPVQDRNTGGVILSQSHPSFVPMQDVDRFAIREYQLDGYLVGFAVGRADRTIGVSDPFFETRAIFRAGWNIAPFLRVAAKGQGFARRLDRGAWSEVIGAASARIYLLRLPTHGAIVLQGNAKAAGNIGGTLIDRESFDRANEGAPGAPGSYFDSGSPGIGGFPVHDRPPFPFFGGAETGFHAFGTDSLVGDRFFQSSAELRTGSLRKFSADWGLVGFFEAGKVFEQRGKNTWKEAPLLEDVGFGVRIQVLGGFPSVFRIDASQALSGPRSTRSRIPLNIAVEQTF